MGHVFIHPGHQASDGENPTIIQVLGSRHVRPEYPIGRIWIAGVDRSETAEGIEAQHGAYRGVFCRDNRLDFDDCEEDTIKLAENSNRIQVAVDRNADDIGWEFARGRQVLVRLHVDFFDVD